MRVQNVQKILLGKVGVPPPPHGAPTIEPAFIEWQSTICRSLSPPGILGKKPKVTTKVTLTSHQYNVNGFSILE